MAALLDVRRLQKRFGGVVATDDVTLEVEPGEAHARDRVGGRLLDAPAQAGDRAAARARQAKDRAHRGGLAHAVPAQQGGDFAGADFQVDAEQHLRGPVRGLQALDAEQDVAAHAFTSACTSSPR